MANVVNVLVGPLAGPECRRALGRGWIILVRLLAALALLGAVLITLWIWWAFTLSDPAYMPYGVLRGGLIAVEVMMLTIALVLGPAVLAGSIAGEKQRGVLALLLTTRVNTHEIIAGRLLGKLTQVAMILLVGMPAVVVLAGLAGMQWPVLGLLLALPAAVAVGGAGLAVLTSTLSRRGRDALLTVYLLDVFFLMTPMGWRLGWSSGLVEALGALNPFVCLVALVWSEERGLALVSIELWLAIGLVASGLAAWRLRPAALRPLDSERVGRGLLRRGRIPPVNEKRPMLWKELYIERVAALGGLGYWLVGFLCIALTGGSLILGGLYALGIEPIPAQGMLGWAVGGSILYFGWMVEWAVGLRAAVAIASERERGTWEAILTSPLEGREIVRAKLRGSLHALRWLFASILLAWTVAVLCRSISRLDYITEVISTAILASFMAAVGVRTSLTAPTATRAMATTIGVWLGSKVAVVVVARILVFVAFLFLLLTFSLATVGGVAPPPRWVLAMFNYAWVVDNAIYLLLTVLLVSDTRLRFDRLAGRMTAGRLATSLDVLIHGKPKNPWRRRKDRQETLPQSASDGTAGDHSPQAVVTEQAS
jgi:ABC-type Na+ efflux pump permease subunit